MSGPDWNARWRAGALFGDAPTAFLREIATRPDFRARTALMLADGDGRNGVWLARRGLTVTGVDLSEEATALAEARDRAAGVVVERVVADLLEWRPAAERRWDCVGLLFLQGPLRLRLGALRLAAELCAPEGWLLLEGFADRPARGAMLGPTERALRWSAAEARATLSDFDLVVDRREVAMLEDGWRHSGLAALLRLAARRVSRQIPSIAR